MLFNSWHFLVLLLITLPLYYLPLPAGRRVWQVTLLLAASTFFYAWEEPRLLLLLGCSCLLNAIAVERILYWKAADTEEQEDGTAKAKKWLAFTVASNLAFLAFFKYAGFLALQLPDGWLGDEAIKWLRTIPLPVGISFYTFQGISLVVDAWRKEISPETRARLARRGAQRVGSIRDTSFYISFFPQLVAGPIVKAHEFVDQIGAKRFSEIDWKTVRRCLILGYFLKVFVADNLAEQTASLTIGADLLVNRGPLSLMPLLYGYGFQIFADFAGYSLIAIGLGAMFGYKLPENFNFPYLSTSITEFWRRWHISLSSWLRDYLYIPLGGNRKGSGRTYFNLFTVMFLGGLWHGAAWKFAIWGTLHGCFLGLERFLARRRGKLSVQKDLPRWFIIMRATMGWFFAFHVVVFLWLTFMMPDLESIIAFFKGVMGGNMGFSGPPIYSMLFYGTAVVIYHMWGWLREHRSHLAERLSNSPLEPALHGLMLFLILSNPGAPSGFIYFQF